MNRLAAGALAVVVAIVATYLQAWVVYWLKDLRNAWLMRRGRDGIRDVVFVPTTWMIPACVIGMAVGAILPPFLSLVVRATIGGLALMALLTPLTILGILMSARGGPRSDP